jgi:hypothetical protein
MLLGAGFMAILCLTLYLVMDKDQRGSIQKSAIEAGVAQYNGKTGKFEWLKCNKVAE